MTQTMEKMDADSVQEGSSRADFLAVLLRRKWIVLLCAGLGFGLGQLYFNKAKPVYQSKAQIALGFHNASLARRGESMDTSTLPPTILSTELVTISSRALLEQAAAKADLAKLSSINANSVSEAANAIQWGVVVTKGGPTLNTEDAAVLSVGFKGPDRLDAPKVVEAILQAYSELLEERSSQSSQETLRQLTQAVQNTNDKIDVAKREYQEWRKTAPLVFFDQHGKNPHAQRLVDIDSQRSKERLRMTEMRAEMQMLEEALKEGNASVNAALVMMVERHGTRSPENNGRSGGTFVDQSLVQLMIQEQDLALTYGPDHPKVKNIRKTIELIQQLQTGDNQAVITSPQHFLTLYLDSLRQESRRMEQQERELTQAFEQERELAKELLNHEHANSDWLDKIDRLRKMFDTLTTRLEELRFNDDASGVTMKRLSDPSIGSQIEPSWPRSLAAGTVLGVLLGVGLAYVIDMADKSFRTPDEIRGQLRLPVIGHIPVIDTVSSRRERSKKLEGASKVDDIIACHHRPRSNVSEAYRSIRTAIYFGSRGEEYKVIQVTSADAGDGKTTLVCNLAVSFAQSGKRVCLVDADFRRSRIHVMFGLDNTTGISSVMAGQTELPDAIRPTEIENLWVLPCGPRPSNPSELLTSHRFKELLDVLRGKFDMILIDTPPLLAVTDPCAVAPRVDSVLLCIRITKHVRPNAIRAKEVLEGLGAKVVGIVVNGVEVRRTYGHDTGYRRYAISGYGYRDYEYGDYYDDEEKQAQAVVPAQPVNDASA